MPKMSKREYAKKQQSKFTKKSSERRPKQPYTRKGKSQW